MAAKRLKRRGLDESDTWDYGGRELNVAREVRDAESQGSYTHKLEDIVEAWFQERLRDAPDLEGVRGPISGVLSHEDAQRIDSQLP